MGTPCGAPEQLIEQPPQLLESVWMLASQPSPGLLLQSVKPGLQRKLHSEPAHVGAELVRGGHAEPHALQLVGLVIRLAQVPEQFV